MIGWRVSGRATSSLGLDWRKIVSWMSPSHLVLIAEKLCHRSGSATKKLDVTLPIVSDCRKLVPWMSPSHLVLVAEKLCHRSGSATKNGKEPGYRTYSRTPTSVFTAFFVAEAWRSLHTIRLKSKWEGDPSVRCRPPTWFRLHNRFPIQLFFLNCRKNVQQKWECD